MPENNTSFPNEEQTATLNQMAANIKELKTLIPKVDRIETDVDKLLKHTKADLFAAISDMLKAFGAELNAELSAELSTKLKTELKSELKSELSAEFKTLLKNELDPIKDSLTRVEKDIQELKGGIGSLEREMLEFKESCNERPTKLEILVDQLIAEMLELRTQVNELKKDNVEIKERLSKVEGHLARIELEFRDVRRAFRHSDTNVIRVQENLEERLEKLEPKTPPQ